jgi:hypothetical protein
MRPIFLNAISNIPHAEGRPGTAGARLDARTAPNAAHSCPGSERIPPFCEVGHTPSCRIIAAIGFRVFPIRGICYIIPRFNYNITLRLW